MQKLWQGCRASSISKLWIEFAHVGLLKSLDTLLYRRVAVGLFKNRMWYVGGEVRFGIEEARKELGSHLPYPDRIR
jgi:hypothetical protein